MASRKIEDLTPRMQEKILAFNAALQEALLDAFHISCTYRSQAEQNILWMQGRKSVIDVNAARETIDLAPITKQQNVRVTWRTISIHTSREAVDYYVLKDGKYCDDLKVDIDQDDVPDWQEFGEIAAKCGLEWGGAWSKPDFPHVQWKD